MYSPTQPDFQLDSDMQGMTSQHTTVGAVPVRQAQRNSGVFNHPASYHHPHQRQNSFGTAASIAMSPPRAMPFSSVADPNSANWFSTSIDSSSSFGQSPPIFRPDLIVSPSNSTSHLDSFAANDDDEAQQRNLQEMFEKRRRRRESHNAVERRRRDNINERIQELSTLLPENLLESAPASSNVNNINAQNGGKAINKGMVLKLSVDHIKSLQDEVTRYKERVHSLERLIEAAQRGEPLPGGLKMDSMQPYPSASNSSPMQPHPQQQQQQQQQQQPNVTPTPSQRRHERVGSLQFQQQFGNLHIASEDPHLH
ncbi:helix-loop-helix DNA-binding domain-containing protein [Gongronella butleri]|nr:helix-loop-helix DNA-binding domain-containing protein [Gongronella butleri]